MFVFVSTSAVCLCSAYLFILWLFEADEKRITTDECEYTRWGSNPLWIWETTRRIGWKRAWMKYCTSFGKITLLPSPRISPLSLCSNFVLCLLLKGEEYSWDRCFGFLSCASLPSSFSPLSVCHCVCFRWNRFSVN